MIESFPSRGFRSRVPVQNRKYAIGSCPVRNRFHDLICRAPTMYAEHTVAKFAGSLQCPGEYFDLTLPALPVSRASIEANLANQPCLAYAIFQKINLLVALADKLRMQPDSRKHITASLGPFPVLWPGSGRGRDRQYRDAQPITLLNEAWRIGMQIDVTMEVESSNVCPDTHAYDIRTVPTSAPTSAIPLLNTSA